MAWLGRPKAAAAGAPPAAAGPVVVEPKTGAAFPLVAPLLKGRAAAGAPAPPAEEEFRCLGVGLRVKKLLVVPVRVREPRNPPYPCPRRPRGIAAPPCTPRTIVPGGGEGPLARPGARRLVASSGPGPARLEGHHQAAQSCAPR